MTKIPLEDLMSTDELDYREQTKKKRVARMVELEQDIKDAEQNGADPEVLENLKARFDTAVILNYLDLQAISYLKMYQNFETLVRLHEINGRVKIRKVAEL